MIISKLCLKSISKRLVFLFVFFISFVSRWYTDAIVAFVQEYAENFSSYTLSWQRTLTFLPFFLFRYFLTEQKLRTVTQSFKNKRLAILLFVFTMAGTCLYSGFTYGVEEVFKGSYGADEFVKTEDSFSDYASKTFIHYGLAVWLCYLIVNIISDKSQKMTNWGDCSLSIYMFPPIFVFVLIESNLLDSWPNASKLIVLF